MSLDIPNMSSFLQIRNFRVSSNESPANSIAEAGISFLIWISSLSIPIYTTVQLLYKVPIYKSERQATFLPAFVQLVVMFGATALVTSVTQILTLHFAASQASDDRRHNRTRVLVEKAMRTAALQFLSTSCFQVLFEVQCVLKIAKWCVENESKTQFKFAN